MTAQDCLEELRRIKDAAFATVDETGAPQVRIIDVMLAEAGALLPARGADTLRIATKPMTEQYVLGEMLDLLVEQACGATSSPLEGARWRGMTGQSTSTPATPSPLKRAATCLRSTLPRSPSARG